MEDISDTRSVYNITYYIGKMKRQISRRRVFEVFRIDNFRCVYCGRGPEDGVKLHCDHLIPYSKGGRTEIENMVTSCDKCNISKSNSLLTPKEVYNITRSRESNYTLINKAPMDILKEKVRGFFILRQSPNTIVECVATVRK